MWGVNNLDNFDIYDLTATASRLRIDTSGNAFFSADVEAVDFNSTSDESLKDNIETLNKTNVLEQLRPVSFNWKHNDAKAYGLIAQEVEKVLPEIVSENSGTKSVAYIQLIPFLIQEILELKQEIKELKES